uniref:Phospholipid/glycerol acyltransferase domain-containing protein n=1 Tax=Mycena chlorophos TaxID=658473 RepID=A0ABQ0LSL3_MYCCL|nr:predicted protein [Mycena chlorophos]
MEKYSQFRDPGTGVQPFLPLVPPAPNLVSKVLVPLAWLVGVLRIALLLMVFGVYLALSAVSVVLRPIPYLGPVISLVFTAISARLALVCLSLWVSVENVTRKRGRSAKDIESWHPRAGDLIVSNWVSWVEVLWLAARFDPVFVLPVTETAPSLAPAKAATDAISHTPGRRTGTGSANVQSAVRAATERVPVAGFRQVSLLTMLLSTGRTPLFSANKHESLETIRARSRRPVVAFPECTTSNGRALLRFADVFKQKVPVQGYNVFVMCVRYDPPTHFSATLAHTVPTALNPLPHIWSVATSLAPQTVSIRLLAPSESPSSQIFVTSEFLSGPAIPDPLAEVCAALIAQIGKMKRTGMGWEDKSMFLDFFHSKERR